MHWNTFCVFVFSTSCRKFPATTDWNLIILVKAIKLYCKYWHSLWLFNLSRRHKRSKLFLRLHYIVFVIYVRKNAINGLLFFSFLNNCCFNMETINFFLLNATLTLHNLSKIRFSYTRCVFTSKMNIPHECSEIFRKTKKYSRLSRSNICSYTTSIWSIWLTDSLNRGQVIIVIWTLTAFELYQMLFCVMKTERISKYQKLLLTHSHQITFKENKTYPISSCALEI